MGVLLRSSVTSATSRQEMGVHSWGVLSWGYTLVVFFYLRDVEAGGGGSTRGGYTLLMIHPWRSLGRLLKILMTFCPLSLTSGQTVFPRGAPIDDGEVRL